MHEEKAHLKEKLEANFMIVIEGLERTEAQIRQTEQEIYDGTGIEELRRHDADSLFDSVSLTTGAVHVDNYHTVKNAAKSNSAFE